MRVSGADFSWIDDSVIAEAGCVTLVPAAEREAVLAAFGAVASTARPSTSVGNSIEAEIAGDWVHVVEVGDALVVVESNGFQGSRHEVLRPLARRGARKAASYSWNVNADTSLTVARAGKVQYDVDLVCAEEEDLDGVPKRVAALVLEGAADDGDWLACGLAAVATAMQVPFGPEILGPGTLVEVQPPPSDLQRFTGDEWWHEVPELAAPVLALPPATQRRLAAWAAAAAVREGGVAQEPAVLASLDAAELAACAADPASPVALPVALEKLHADLRRKATMFSRFEDDLELGGVEVAADHGYHVATVPTDWGMDRWAISHLEGRFLFQRASAVHAVRYLADPEPASAALGSLHWLVVAVGGGRTERGWAFTEDEHGRWRDRSTPDPRRQGVDPVLLALVTSLGTGDDEGAFARADAGLPRPLTPQQRTEAIHADALAAARGEFRTYQIIRTEPPEPGDAVSVFVMEAEGEIVDDDEGGDAWLVREVD